MRVGLYGDSGHQIQWALADKTTAQWVAAAVMTDVPPGVRQHADLDALLADPEVELVSFSSPIRAEQGDQILQCLEAGKHAYAEKPCCMDESTLDRIIETAERRQLVFHEMAGTAFAQPYCTLREIVASGQLGEVIQVFSQKAYPWGDWRPTDERVDGGLAMQVGIYNARFVEHVAGMRIASMALRETRLGNLNANSDCRRAVSFLMTFENGGVGSAIANYACPPRDDWTGWGYEILRIFGTKGFVESIDNGRIGTLALAGQKPQALSFTAPGRDMLDMVLEEVATGNKVVPIGLSDELSPTRWVIRAKRDTSTTQRGSN
ncbi:MAG: Gfo/Idh/MocA family oxidoreductase [Verrucomicrobia bacterium]|nr:Gfo/Idh/MocA family oxidoreductase [Verrucomicrobiota bacterium]